MCKKIITHIKTRKTTKSVAYTIPTSLSNFIHIVVDEKTS